MKTVNLGRGLLTTVLVLSLLLSFGGSLPVSAADVTDATYQTLPFSQDWTDINLITTNDDWSGVSGIVGYLGNYDAGSPANVDPQTLLADYSTTDPDVIANLLSPSTSGGVAEFEITDPVVALQGSGTADAPFILIHVDTTGYKDISVSYNVRDVDGAADNAVQQVALHYRVGGSGDYTNIPAAYIPDATTGPSLADLVTPINITLPSGADNQPQVQLRIMTTNATGSDEWVGIDDISITGTLLAPAIALNKTVGTDPLACATTDEIALPPGGGEVTYCYEVTNTGNLTLNLHDLDDSELGNIFSGLAYVLAPAASAFITASATITTTTVNTALWTAYNVGPTDVVTATDVATVTVEASNPSIALNKTVGTDPLACATTDEIALPPGGGEVTYCYEVTNTGNLTLNLHDLDDSELGNIFSGLNYALAPAASVFVTESATIATTTVNMGMWTAFNEGGPSVTATDVATVTVELANPSIALNKTVGTDPLACATTDEIALPPGGGEVTYCYEVTNTGNLTLNLHDLDDSELGNIFSGLAYVLAPAASVFVTTSATIATTTVNSAQWTAYNAGGPSVTATDVATVTVEVLSPNIFVDPLSLSSAQLPDVITQQTLTISNTGEADLNWEILTGLGDPSEGFDDITLLPGQGWFFQNNSAALGTTDWFQGNDGVFPAQAGAATAYIGANFNNTSGVGTISNWMLTPEMSLVDGDTISFWTRVPTGSPFPDRLELRLSTNGASTNVGTLATDVGDFTTLLLSINPTLAVGGYPDVWTQYSVTLAGIPAGATGRVAFRYFVENAGPSGSNSDYIGIDTFEYISAQVAVCDALADVPWLSTDPISGTTAVGGATPVDVTFDSTGLAPGTYTANLCVASNDPDAGPGNETDLVVVPVELTVQATSIALTKTVGTVPGVCATTDDITVLEGTEVYYCYEVTNTGDVTLTLHSLVDSQLGTILSGFAYPLAPGASVNTVAAGLSLSAVITTTTVNTATWTAYNANEPSVTATDIATVTVEPLAPSIVLTKTVGTVPGVCATTDDITVMEGTEVYYCYQIQNTGNVTLTVHDLVDTELGTILTAFPYDLAPGASSPTVIVPETLSVTTVNTATWTAYIVGGPTATATDSARVVVTPSAVSVTGLRASASGGWSGIALLGAVAFGGFVWRRKRR